MVSGYRRMFAARQTSRVHPPELQRPRGECRRAGARFGRRRPPGLRFLPMNLLPITCQIRRDRLLSSHGKGGGVRMSILDKVVAAVTPMESDQQRQQARAQALAAAGGNDWLSLVLSHHTQIDAAFEALRGCPDAASRRAAQKELGVLLTGHANAEEAVLYPAMARMGEKGAATTSFTEQAGAKIALGEMEFMDPMSQEYLDKLEHVCGAVRHHMYEEESSRFLELKQKMPQLDQDQLTQRFREEFNRYAGHDLHWEDGSGMAAARAGMPASTPPLVGSH